MSQQQSQKPATQKPPQKPPSKAQSEDTSTLRERERQHEVRKAAAKARKLQKQAKELINAAAAAGDPDERQRLLQKALEKEVEAGTFGKTARYLNTGEAQGLCAGAGLGAGIGVALGTLTGTIVGGTTGTITGGLGAGIGLGVGAMHGPWFDVSSVMAKGIRRVTGDLPGWKATEEQKAALEKMVNGIQETPRPVDEELLELSEGGGGSLRPGKGYTGQREADERQKGILQGDMPSWPSMPWSQKKEEPKSKVEENPAPNKQQAARTQQDLKPFAGEGVNSNAPSQAQKQQKQKRPAAAAQSRTNSTAAVPQSSNASRRSSRVQQTDQSTPVEKKGAQQPSQPSQPKKKPRKLEKRS